jgi:hypothetical protein
MHNFDAVVECDAPTYGVYHVKDRHANTPGKEDLNTPGTGAPEGKGGEGNVSQNKKY